jgi:hypothetical protein
MKEQWFAKGEKHKRLVDDDHAMGKEVGVNRW